MLARTRVLLRPVQILIVEDNATDAHFIKEALKHSWLPMSFVVAEDGLKALDYLHRQADFANSLHPDLILLDLNLPKKDGWEVLREIRRNPAFTPVPVVILTGSKDDTDAEKARDGRADLYVVKPLDAAHFSLMVKSVERILVEKFEVKE